MSRQDGFTLLEIVIAALLLATVSVGLFAAFVSANRWIQQPRNDRANDVAFNVARQRLENLYGAVREDWWLDNAANRGVNSGLNMTPGHTGELMTDPASGETLVVNLDGMDYRRGYRVSAVTIGGAEAYRRAEVNVHWN